MPILRLGLLGFGKVNRALVELLLKKDSELRELYEIEWLITGIASRRIGWRASKEGMKARDLLLAQSPESLKELDGVETRDCSEWLEASRPDVVFEATSLNVDNGQPAVDHIRKALEHGAHAITANKGPIVHGYAELRKVAKQHGRQFLFESTVMDGVPIFSLFQNCLPALQVIGFKGILNSTTNVILTGMEQGFTFADSLARAQELGIAESDATYDIDGWDAAVKVSAIATVVMGVHLPPQQVRRDGIRALSREDVCNARKTGTPYKLVCRARRQDSGVHASVRPEQVPLGDPMALVDGTSSIIQFETDIFPGITITEENPGLYATAYGMLADFIRAANSP